MCRARSASFSRSHLAPATKLLEQFGLKMNSQFEPANVAEVIERDAWQDMFAAAPVSVAQDLGLAFGRIGGIGVLGSSVVPITEFNRAMAIGADRPASPEALDASIAWLQAHAAQDWAIQLNPASGA
jgi:hypothetical protein